MQLINLFEQDPVSYVSFLTFVKHYSYIAVYARHSQCLSDLMVRDGFIP